MNRRSLLKTIGACLGFGLWSKTGECTCDCGEVEPESVEVVIGCCCDPLPLPPGDFEKGTHNATFIRDIVPGLAWVQIRTMFGVRYRAASVNLDRPPGLWSGQRLVLEGDEIMGLSIKASFT